MADTIRLLHLADVHLDHPFAWAGPSLARQRRQAIRDALERALGLVRTERADAVLCAGDLFDVDLVTPDTVAFLVATFQRLAPTPVLIAPGNHDWYSEESPYAQATWPSNVTVFRSHRLEPVPLAPDFTVWGAAHLAPSGTPDLLAGARVDGPGLHLGLVHGAESRDHRPSERSALPLDPHAPFEPEEVRRAGLVHLCTGHYHSPRDEPLYTYPGNPEALGFVHREGTRGPVVHTFDGVGRHRRARFDVDSGTLSDLRLDVSGCASQQDLRGRIATALAERRGAVRVDLAGELPPAVALDLEGLGDCAPWLDALLCRDAGVHIAHDLEALAREQTVRGQFVRDVTDPAAGLDDPLRERVLTIGLRALEGRDDLGVVP